MKLVDDALFPWTSRPGLVLPAIGFQINHFADTVNVMRLMARSRVWHFGAIGQHELVETARPDAADAVEVPTVLGSLHQSRRASRDLQGDAFYKGSPKPELNTVFRHAWTKCIFDQDVTFPFE
jgi:hypothetical protein